MAPKKITPPKGQIQKSLKQGLSIRETAAATGLSRSTVHRAKKSMDAATKDPVLGPVKRKPTASNPLEQTNPFKDKLSRSQVPVMTRTTKAMKPLGKKATGKRG